MIVLLPVLLTLSAALLAAGGFLLRAVLAARPRYRRRPERRVSAR